MTQDNTKQTILSNPEVIRLAVAAKKKEAELLAISKGWSTQNLFKSEDAKSQDPIGEARKTSPLLQYLHSSQAAPTLPDAEIDTILSPKTKNQLGTFNQSWSTWADGLKQIYAHGFEVGDTVTLRLIVPKNTPEDFKKVNWLGNPKKFDLELLPDNQCRLIPYSYKDEGLKNGKPTGSYFKDYSKATLDWWQELARLNRKGYGVYLLPNKGGNTDNEIVTCQNAFYETDDKSFKQQQAQLNDFTAKTGVAPTVVVRTRKSLHVYFRLAKEDWEPETWSLEVQKPTILAFQSDPSIHNRARPMRLAGFYHVKFEHGEFHYQMVDMWVCKPHNVYSKAEYLDSLKKYSGSAYSEVRFKALNHLTNKTTKDYLYLDSSRQILPKHHQITQCPEELISELERRLDAYISLLRKEHNGDEVDPTDAWTKELGSLHSQRNFDYSGIEDEGEPDVIRWAKYLYGYNPYGRPGWITGQDPTIPESERDNHSLDSLHINQETGAYASHRGTTTTEVYRALKELAFKSNPQERKIYAEKWKRLKVAQRKLEGEITKEEYEARNLKPELTELEKQEQTVNLVEYSAAKEAKKEQDFVDYLERLKIKRHRARKYYECNEEKLSTETYSQFPTIAECQKEGQILALKAPKGTGKSTRIKQYINEARAACWLTVSVTLRRNLGLAQSHDWDIKWVDEDGMEGFFQGQCNTMSCCWDSLHKFIKADYRDKEILLIIDEVESGLDHLSTADTIGKKGKRVEIYQELRRILAHIAKCGGLVIAADADLSDSSVEFLQTIGKTLPVTVIENHYLETKRAVKVFNHQDGQVKLAIRDAIQFGLPFLFASDSIEGAKGMHDYAKKYLESINCPELLDKIWLINSETGHFQENKTRIVDINKAIREQEPIALFYTPTINVGVSIDGSHFREGFGIFKGTIIADAARQMIARNREVISWVLFADNTANKSKLSPDVLTDPSLIKENIFEETHATQLHTAYISKKLIEEELRATNVNKGLAYIELALKLENDRASFDTAEFHLLANILAKNNYQWKNFHKVFCYGMESEGWTVESLKGSKTGFCEELKELRAERVKQESEAIAKSDHTQIISQDTKVPTRLDYDIANDILRSSEDKAMRAAAYKVKVAYWCKVDINRVDAELVELIKFNHRWLSQVKFQMYLQNEEIIKTIDGYKINKMAQQYSETGLISQGDLKAKAVQVAAIKEFGLLNVIDLNDDEQTFKKSDFMPLFKRLKNYTNKDLKAWGKKCGIPIKSRHVFEDPIKLAVRPMLAKMGYSITIAKKDAKGDTHYRIPAEEINSLPRALTLEGLLADWAEQQAQRGLRLTGVAEVNLEKNPLIPALEPAASEYF